MPREITFTAAEDLFEKLLKNHRVEESDKDYLEYLLGMLHHRGVVGEVARAVRKYSTKYSTSWQGREEGL